MTFAFCREVRRGFLCLLCLLFCGSSACGRIRLPDIRDYRALEGEERAGVVSRINEWKKLPNAFRSKLAVQVSAGIERQDIQQAVVYEAPSSLRIDTFATSFNKLISLVIVTGTSFVALDTDKQVAYLGTNSPDNIARLTHLPLTQNEYAAWMLGFYPGDLSEGSVTVLRKTRSKEEVAVEQDFPDGRKMLAYLTLDDSSEPRIRFLELKTLLEDGSTAKVLSEYRFDPKQMPCGKTMPSEMKFSLSTVSVSGTVRCESMEVDPDLTELRERLFTLRPQSLLNVQVLHLD